MGRIPEDIIQQVIASTDIVELVGRHVKLKRAGANFVGLCPFHNERTPSFNVSPSRNSYHCFGCGAGGTSITFVKEFEGLPFPEAVRKLAAAAGIHIQEEEWDENTEREHRDRATLVKVHQRATLWFHQLLMRHVDAAPARDYLKSRGISADIARKWQLGYCPQRAVTLMDWARREGFSDALLLQAGILADSEGRLYPRFSGRLTFPICNDNGDPIAFSARLLTADAKRAKYLNSPETPVFSKSHVFFGFHKCRKAIAKSSQAIVCEGQIDLVMAYEAGFQNVVAALGTAFTEHHARILRRHADEVVLCYDSDGAGLKAAQRAFEILAPTGLAVRMAALPAGDDPDTLIRREGPAAFAALIEAAPEFVDFQLDAAARQPDFDQPRQRTAIAARTTANIALMDSPAARATACQRAAIRLGLSAGDIERMVRRARSRAEGQAGSRAAAPSAASAAPPPKENAARSLLQQQDRNSRILLQMALKSEDVIDWLRGTGKAALLRDVPGTELLSLVWESDCHPCEPSSMTAFLSALDHEQAGALVMLQNAPLPLDGQTAEATLAAIELTRLDCLIRSHTTQLRQSNLSADESAAIQSRLLALRKEYLDRRKAG
jgi:DNA primase